MSIPEDILHWGVTVRVNGQDIVTIESNHLSGVHDIEPYESAIRTCAQHLLSFIGDPAPSTNG